MSIIKDNLLYDIIIELSNTIIIAFIFYRSIEYYSKDVIFIKWSITLKPENELEWR